MFKPCPFCGSGDVLPYDHLSVDEIICQECCGQSPADAWNTRQPDKLAIVRERVVNEWENHSHPSDAFDEALRQAYGDVIAIIDSVGG